MPPFIQHTKEPDRIAGTARSLVFINVSHITQATFAVDTGKLDVQLDNGGDWTLEGQEAKDAVEKLQSLK